MPSSMRADGMYNFMTDACIHRGAPGHFNIQRQKKHNLPQKRNCPMIINRWREDGANEKWKIFVHGQQSIYENANFNIKHNYEQYLELQHIYLETWIWICISNWSNPHVCTALIRTLFIIKIIGLFILTGDALRHTRDKPLGSLAQIERTLI